jgi:Fe-S oxidoreductase
MILGEGEYEKPVGVEGSSVEKTGRRVEPRDAVMRVGYFPGCAESLCPQVARATLEVLREYRIAAVIPKGLVCCGAPFLEAGDFATARKLARKNTKALEELGLEAIVTSCTSGARVLRRYYKELLGISGLPAPVFHLAEFLTDALPEAREFLPVHLKACYLPSLGLDSMGECVVQLLARIPGLELLQPETSPSCCGESLFFPAIHPGLFRKMLRRQAGDIAACGCHVVVTDSSFSMIQLQRSLEDHKEPIRVMHVAEVLAQALGGRQSSSAEVLLKASNKNKS